MKLSLTHSGLDSYTVSYPTFLGSKYDASATNLTYLIPAPASYPKSTQPLEIVLSFLSPITPTSTLRQSIPASYLTVYVKGSFDVDVYVDVNGLWVTGDRGNDIVWELGQTELGESDKGLKTWKVKRKTEQLLTEHEDRAEWGTLHFTGPSVSSRHFFDKITAELTICTGRTPRVGHLCFTPAALRKDWDLAECR